MATKQNQTLVQRIALDGGDEIKKELLALGKAGESAFKALERQAVASKRAATGLNADVLRLRTSFTNLGNAVKKVGSNFAFLSGAAAQFGTLVATAFSAQALIESTTMWTDLKSRIQLAVGAGQDADAVLKRIAQTARGTYTSLEATGTQFADNSFILNDLGVSTEKQLDIQEAFNNAMVVSGARGQRLEQVQRSFSNALALGALRGEDFNNFQKAGGRLMQLLADKLGVGVSALKAMAAQGLLTRDVLIDSLLPAQEQLAAEAAAMPATIKDAFQNLQTSFIEYIGTADQANGASARIAETIAWIGDNLNILIPLLFTLLGIFIAIKALQIGQDFLQFGKVLLKEVIPAVWKLTLALLANPWVAAAVAITAIIALVVQLTGGFEKWGAVVMKVASDIYENLKPLIDPIVEFVDWILKAISGLADLAGALAGVGVGGGGGELPGFASGGAVRGPGTGTSDSVLARLSDGEFVMRAKAVRKWGLGMLNRLNAGLPAFANGGLVTALPGLGSAPDIGKGMGGGGFSGRPLTLVLDGQSFGGLSAPEDVADSLSKFVAGRKVRSAGKKPGWFGK